MPTSNIIEKAVRLKLRFDTGTQIVTIEDLYDIPMNTKQLSGDSLNNAWRILNGQIKAYSEESFTLDNHVLDNLVLAKEVVEHVIAVRQEENALELEKVEQEEMQKRFLQAIDTEANISG